MPGKPRSAMLFVIGLCIAACIFVLLELALKTFNFSFYPNDLRFFLNDKNKLFTRDGAFYKTNPLRKGIFVDQEFPVQKKGYRVFILGESSINCLGGFAYLKQRLEDRWPNIDFELINAGGLSYGSSRLLLVFQEIIQYNPDLVLLYIGHNEFEEASLKSLRQNSLLQRLNNTALSLRTYQLLSLACYNIKKHIMLSFAHSRHKHEKFLYSPKVQVDWTMTFNDQDKKIVYDNYKRNIEMMIRTARSRSIPIVVSTVASNELNIAPFYSLKYHAMDIKEIMGNREAIEFMHKESTDPFVEYAAGVRYYIKRDFPEAKRRLERAFVLDAHPHRANAITNAVVKGLAVQYGVVLADVEKAVADRSLGGIPSFDLFEDQCHLDEKGNRILMDEFFEAIIKASSIS